MSSYNTYGEENCVEMDDTEARQDSALVSEEKEDAPILSYTTLIETDEKIMNEFWEAVSCEKKKEFWSRIKNFPPYPENGKALVPSTFCFPVVNRDLKYFIAGCRGFVGRNNKREHYLRKTAKWMLFLNQNPEKKNFFYGEISQQTTRYTRKREEIEAKARKVPITPSSNRMNIHTYARIINTIFINEVSSYAYVQMFVYNIHNSVDLYKYIYRLVTLRLKKARVAMTAGRPWMIAL